MKKVFFRKKAGINETFLEEFTNDDGIIIYSVSPVKIFFAIILPKKFLIKNSKINLNLSRMKNFFMTACLTFIICYTPSSNMFIIIYTVCHHLNPVRTFCPTDGDNFN